MNARSRSRQPLAAAGVTSVLMVLTGLVVPEAAAAEESVRAASFRFGGSTSQGKPITTLVPEGFGRVSRVSLSWTAPCATGAVYQDSSIAGPFHLRATRPWRGLEFGGIAKYRVDVGDGNAADVQETLHGRVGSRGPMTGTFRAIATVSGPDGQPVDTCNSGTVTWRANQR